MRALLCVAAAAVTAGLPLVASPASARVAGAIVLTATPTDPSRRDVATFVWTSSGSAPAPFQCRLDADPVTACRSPWTYAGLSVGRHRFAVAAGGDAASYSWKVTGTGFGGLPNNPLAILGRRGFARSKLTPIVRPGSPSAPYYDVVQLPPTSGGPYPLDLNEAGDVAGTYPDANVLWHAVVWHARRPSYLPTLGGAEAEASGINDRGQVVGDSEVTSSDEADPHATLWKGGQPVDLGTLGGRMSWAFKINDGGEVVGNSYRADGVSHAFLWRDGAMIDLGALGPWASRAYGINERGEVVGDSMKDDPFVNRAVLWRPLQGSKPAATIELPTVVGRLGSSARSINDRSQIVGGVGGVLDPMHSVMWENGTLKPLDRLDAVDSGSIALAINNSTQVVGGKFDLGYGGAVIRAYLWQNGVLTDLNSLIPKDVQAKPWLATADAINDRGQITAVGWAAGDGAEHAFLLTPRTHLTSLTITPTTAPGSQTAEGLVTLNQPAPPGGATVLLADARGSADPVASVPARVVVPVGARNQSFSIPTVAIPRSAATTISAAYDGDTKTARLVVRPIGVRSLELSPNPAHASTRAVVARVRLEAPAAPGPIVVRLTTSNPGLTSLPASAITIPVGVTSATFPILLRQAQGPRRGTLQAVITAVANGIVRSQRLNVVP